ncbi:MAG TPA: DUF4097 family beta strand repeat-containing protein [Thermoanaerobaculia bacterium]|nr:DUF4097 family beta strand repeat-containing protein [Thermoanaerobaculia bacterium]HUM30621.1 DUF4097 family beta strand repeat-containing protein [Thermoanaerobaculia bacterium]HXK68851.1 DUF4097 family beta strand repeat-containing protein [Thermoanaerobaculia bacterium]
MKKVSFFAILFLSAMLVAGTVTSHHEKTLKAIPDGTVVVDVSFHNVDVTVRPGESVSAVVDLEISGDKEKAEAMLKEYEPTFEVKDNKIVIKSQKRSKGSFSWKKIKARGHVVLDMPPSMSLSVDSSSGNFTFNGDLKNHDLDIDLSSGNISLDGAMKSLDIDASSGNVNARFSHAVDKVSIDLSSGSVTLDGPVANLSVDASSGNIDADGLTGSARIDTSSGTIEASWTSITPGSRITADASSGNVTLTLPAGTQLSGSIDVGSGNIESDFPFKLFKDRGHAEFSGGPGSIPIEVDTSSGSVTIREK